MKKGLLIKVFLPILIIFLGWAGMKYLAHLKSPPKKKTPHFEGPLVEVMHIKIGDYKVHLMLTGEVQARHLLRVVPEVSGRVIWVNPRFEGGGYIEEGEPFFKIDPVPYEAQRAKAQDALKQAMVNLEEVRSKAKVAREEWEKIHRANESPESPLVLFGPQLEAAEAKVRAATSALQKATQDLARTKVVAPFSCIVQEERIEPGTYVRAGEEVAKVIGTDSLEVKIPMTLHDYLLLGGDSGARGKGVHIALWGMAGNESVPPWVGRIERVLPSVTEKERMLQVIAVVDDPFQPLKGEAGRTSLRVNSFVECQLEGSVLKGVFPVPEKALKDEAYVWRVDGDNRLRIVKVEVVQRERQRIFVRGPLSDGAMIVLSNIRGATDGMRVRPTIVGEGS